MLRVVIDSQARDCSAKFPADQITIVPADLGRDTIRRIIQARQSELRRMLDAAENHIRPQSDAVITRAQQKMQHIVDSEIDRLQHLGQINPNVRPEEIKQLIAQRDQLWQSMLQLQPMLDAVRVFITS